jgi:hypothetical protein
LRGRELSRPTGLNPLMNFGVWRDDFRPLLSAADEDRRVKSSN